MDVYENGRVNKKRKHDIAQGLSSRTVKDVKIVLHAVLEKAVDEGIIDKNPTDKLNMPKDRVNVPIARNRNIQRSECGDKKV